MCKKHFMLLFSIFMVFTTSCNPPLKNQVIIDENFPLSKRWTFESDVPIYSIGVSDGWIAISQENGVTALETATGEVLWKLNIPLNNNSPLFVSEGYLISAEKTQIDVIDKTGKPVSKVEVALQGEVEQILAVYSDFIFVRRFPSWNLEVYNMWTGNKVWELVVHRANVTIDYDSAAEIVYITTTGFVGAYEIANGNEIWRISKVTRSGILDSDTFYYSLENSANSVSISAINIQNLDKIWKTDVLLGNREVYNLTTVDDMLIVSTDFGIISLDKKDGHELWKSETNEYFYGKLVQVNHILYARGTDTKIIYAISPENGRYVGYLHLGNPPLLISTFHKEYEIVYESDNLLIFTLKNAVYAYQVK